MASISKKHKQMKEDHTSIEGRSLIFDDPEYDTTVKAIAFSFKHNTS